MVGGLVLMSLGCAHRQALKDGDDYAESGSWRQAVVEYREAKEARPKSEEAARKLEKARRRAIEGALERADRRIAERRYEGAASDIAYVRGLNPEHDGAGRMAEQLRREMTRDIEEATERGDAGRAYEVHRTWGELYPDETAGRPTRESIRRVVFERADRMADDGEFREALDELEVVAKNEPSRVPGLVRRRESYRTRWAERLRRRAVEQRRHPGRAGAAAVFYAAAYRVAGRKSDRRKFDKLVDSIGREIYVGVDFRVGGNRAGSFRRAFSGRLRQIQAVELTEPQGADRIVDVEVDPAHCSESVVATEQASKRYLAGTRQVENPDYRRLQGRLEDAEYRLDRLKRRRRQAEHDLRHVRNDLDRFDEHRLRQQKERLEQIRRSKRDHVTDLREIERELQRAERRWERLRRDDDASESEVRQARREYEHLQQVFREEKYKHKEVQRELRQKEEKVGKRLRRYRRLRDKDEQLSRRYREVDAEYEDVHDRIHRLERRLSRTSPTVTEKVYETFHYEVSEWQLDCSRTVSVAVETPDGQRVDRFELMQSASTSDRAHQGFSQYGVGRDAKAYPASRDDLIASVDRELEASFGRGIRPVVAEVVRGWADEAIAEATDNPHRATDSLLGLACYAGVHLEGGQRSTIDGHLKGHYEVGLSQIEEYCGR